jgi:hypothetical protein
MIITLDDADRLRQWFDAVCDVNPEFLDSDDYRLGLSLYDACGMQPSKKLLADASDAPDAAGLRHGRPAGLTEPKLVPGKSRRIHRNP